MRFATRLSYGFAVLWLVVLVSPAAYAAHSTCAGAESVDPMFLIECGSEGASDANGTAGNTYDGTSCTGGPSTDGRDVVWYADMEPGWVLTVTMTPSSSVNAAIYITSDCSDIPTYCVAGSDVAGVGGPETVMYSSTSFTRYYVIFDGVGADVGGSFDVSATLDCSVSTENATWSLMKVRYQ